MLKLVCALTVWLQVFDAGQSVMGGIFRSNQENWETDAWENEN
jgi:hypothetical protein